MRSRGIPAEARVTPAPADRLGFGSAIALTVVCLAYLVVVAVGVARAGLDAPIVDPVLAVMEILTMVAAILYCVLLYAVRSTAQPGRRPVATIALTFGMAMAGLTCAVHGFALAVARRTGSFTLEWPSLLYAVELLAWDVLLGVSLLAAAAVFRGPGLNAAARVSLGVSGVLCLAGSVGPLVGDMALQRIGIVGYGLGLPIASAVVAAVFRARASAC